MADFRRNEDGSVVKVELVEQETAIDVAGLENRNNELEAQLAEAKATVARLETEHKEVKSDLEGARAVANTSDAEDSKPDENAPVESPDASTPEEAPVF